MPSKVTANKIKSNETPKRRIGSVNFGLKVFSALALLVLSDETPNFLFVIQQNQQWS
jgi:hypothetical protein